MTLADIIVQKNDFRHMVFDGLNSIDKRPYLLIQSVSNPSIPNENRLLIRDRTIISCEKSCIVKPESESYKVKSGGMVYLWLKNPFSLIEVLLSNKIYNFKHFIQPIIQKHIVLEMPIYDMWDVDTQEDVLQTEKILMRSPETAPNFV